MDHMETTNTCSLCGEPYYRVEALSGTATLPLRVMPYYKMDALCPKAPHRFWLCCEHGAHTTCLKEMWPNVTIEGPCVVCGLTSPPALNERKLLSSPKHVKGSMGSIPLCPSSEMMKVSVGHLVTEAEKNKNANDGDQNPPMAMPVPVSPKAMPVQLAPWFKKRRK